MENYDSHAKLERDIACHALFFRFMLPFVWIVTVLLSPYHPFLVLCIRIDQQDHPKGNKKGKKVIKKKNNKTEQQNSQLDELGLISFHLKHEI